MATEVMMAEMLGPDGGRIAYDVTGQGPLVALSPGMGDLRRAYRFLRAKLAEPGRMAEFMKTGKSTPAAIAAAMPAGLGRVAMVDGAGHYPHAQCPDEVAALVIGLLKEHARA